MSSGSQEKHTETEIDAKVCAHVSGQQRGSSDLPRLRSEIPSVDGSVSSADPRRMVSEVSRFCDDRWDFIAETRDTGCVFRWDRELSDDSRLNDYPGIVEPLKLYFEALLKGRVISRRRPKITTLSTISQIHLGQFSEFLVLTRKKKSFADVLPSDHFAYAEHLSRRDISAGSKARSLYAVINFFNAEKLTGLKLTLGSKPEFPQSPDKLFRWNRSRVKQTPVIPDAVLWPLFNKTLSFVRDVGP